MKICRSKFYAACVLLVSAGAALALPEFDAAQPKAFPEQGVRFPVLARATALPERMPETRLFFFNEDGEDERLDFFSPPMLWYLDQLVGQWITADGVALRVARVTCRPPELDAPALTYEDFADFVLSDENRITKRTPQPELLEWVRVFTGMKTAAVQEVMINRFHLEDALLVNVEDPWTFVYLLRPKFADNRTSNWMAFVLKAPSDTAAEGETPKQWQAMIEEQVVKQLATLSRFEMGRDEEGAVMNRKGLGAATPGGEDHPVRLVARRTVAPYPAWRVTEIDNAILLSDVPEIVGDAFANEVTRVFQPLRRGMARLLPPFSDAPDIAVVRIVRSGMMFERYAGETHKWAAGIYVPSRRELVMRQADAIDEMMRVFKHESTHQYLHGAFAGLDISAWFNEGHAVFFESTTVTQTGRVEFDEHRSYIDIVTQNLDAMTELLESLFAWSYQDFYAGTDDERRARYALSWAFVYYVYKGAPLEHQPTHASLFTTYADALYETGDSREATRRMLATTTMPSLKYNFKNFWNAKRTAARTVDPLKE